MNTNNRVHMQKTIFLDTCFLHKWTRNRLPKKDIVFLEKLKDSDYTFIFTFFHLLETAAQEDISKAQAVASFMDQLPHKWMLTSYERTISEINNTKCQLLYGKTILPNEFPFTNDYTKVIEPTLDSLLFNELIRSKSIVDLINWLIGSTTTNNRYDNLVNIIPGWLNENKVFQEQYKEQEKHKIVVKDRYNKRLEEIIISSPNRIQIKTKKLVLLIKHIEENIMTIPSFTVMFYIQHEMLRNIKRAWYTSDFADIEHSSVIPYVECAVLDRKLNQYIEQATKKDPYLIDNQYHLVTGSVKHLQDKYNKVHSIC